MKLNQRNERGGFTLVDFMVIMVVLSVLAAILLPALRPPRGLNRG